MVGVVLVVSALATPLRLVPTPPQAADPGLHVRFLNLTTPRQKVIPAVLATIDSPAGFAHVFTAGAIPDRCDGRVKPSETASAAGCLYAVNAGPFNMQTGGCVGSVIANGTEVQLDETSGFASWGLSTSNHVFGQVSRTNATALSLGELVSGFIGPLLVADGATVPSSSTLVAPRTAIGADRDGRLLLLTVDGVEKQSLGMNITELGDAFARLGALHALNLDGGGSTSAWWRGHGDAHGVIDTPTCNDGPEKCERAVATIVCISDGGFR